MRIKLEIRDDDGYPFAGVAETTAETLVHDGDLHPVWPEWVRDGESWVRAA